MPTSFWDSLVQAGKDFAYFNTPGKAVDYLENVNSGGEFTDRPLSESEADSLLFSPSVFPPSNDENRDTDPPPSASRVSTSPLKPETIDYINAEYAKHYGMDRATAYQEALSNTSYQRAVADMQAAGLNPAVIFGAGRGSGAGSFSGRVLSSGSSSGSGRSQDDSGFSLSDTAGLIGSAAEFVTQLISKNPSLSRAAGNAAKTLVQTVDKALK